MAGLLRKNYGVGLSASNHGQRLGNLDHHFRVSKLIVMGVPELTLIARATSIELSISVNESRVMCSSRDTCDWCKPFKKSHHARCKLVFKLT